MGVVRIFLAWLVATDHLYHAVLFSCIISGFLITYTLTCNYKRDLSGTLKFYRDRFIRIVSLYWPMVIRTLVLFR